MSDAQTASTNPNLTSLQQAKTSRSRGKESVASKDQILEVAEHTAHKAHDFPENGVYEKHQAHETVEQVTQDAAHDEAPKAAEEAAAQPYSQKFLEHSDAGRYTQDGKAVEHGTAQHDTVERGSQLSAEVTATVQHIQNVAELVTAAQDTQGPAENTPTENHTQHVAELDTAAQDTQGTAEDTPTEKHTQNLEGAEHDITEQDTQKSANIAGAEQHSRDVAAHDTAEQDTQNVAGHDAENDVESSDDELDGIVTPGLCGPSENHLVKLVARDEAEYTAAEQRDQDQEDAEWNVMEQEFKKAANCPDATREQEVLEAEKPRNADPHKIDEAESEDLQLSEARELAELEKHGFVEVAKSSINKAQQVTKKRKSAKLFSDEGSLSKRSRAGLSIPRYQKFITPFTIPGAFIRRIEEIKKLEIKRNLNYIGHSMSTVFENDGRTLNTVNIEAHLVQERGEISSSRCNLCADRAYSLRTWKECVVLDGFSQGSCANCHYGGKGANCSLRCKFYPSYLY
jgi:hypothetical protein